MILSKMSITKNVLLNWYSSTKKKWEKFEWFYESKILALFDSYFVNPNSKFNNFPWVCWFLGKNLSNFVSPVWKLHNPYCHTLRPKPTKYQLFAGTSTHWHRPLWQPFGLGGCSRNLHEQFLSDRTFVPAILYQSTYQTWGWFINNWGYVWVCWASG